VNSTASCAWPGHLDAGCLLKHRVGIEQWLCSDTPRWAMPVIYARISDRPVADEYWAVTTQVETFYTHSVSLPADAEARPAGAYAAALRCCCGRC